MKSDKKKPTHSFLSNAKFALSHMWKFGKAQTLGMFLRSPIVVAVPFLGIFLSREVVAAVTNQSNPQEIISTIIAISAVLMVCTILEKSLAAFLNSFVMTFDFRIQSMIFSKCISCDYENMESPTGLNLMNKAMEHTGSSDSSARKICEIISSFIANIIGIVSYATILFALSPWVLLVITITTIAGFFLLKLNSEWSYSHKDGWKSAERKRFYLSSNSSDFTRAKDIRLYGMVDWFRHIFNSALKERLGWKRKEEVYGFKVDMATAVLSFIRECFAYGSLIYLMFTRNMTAADFVLYFGIIAGFTTWLNGLVSDFSVVNGIHLAFCEMREFLDLPDKVRPKNPDNIPAETFEIEFKNVSYRHCGNDKMTIQNISFKIPKGEKLAIVGLNGAGKTTLIKLLTGLYTPTSGEILINGTNLNRFSPEDYRKLYSVVFQDIFLLPVTIAENIAASTDEVDRQKVIDCINLAGLEEKIASLPKGIDTRLVKTTSDEAIDLSGGELQKLALARALYKDGQALILDEPTAALDPIAESRIYMEYNRMTTGRTSIFISHRLASTGFCDRIFFLENGQIAECGTHNELLAKKGKYYEMFEIQSHYYKENVEENMDFVPSSIMEGAIQHDA